ncbi:acetyl-CoA C-acetyltransferase [Sphingomonas vulcanisoli]|uniref:Acetyl-CoA C-acetyltransferase n=1 Tax=Sphingomonas vulcanisoli TaxID=1658060 RepID=A0ABX0TW05_9SPHN|nr:thiolase family protein [Sphingomonas vulcanisoli]NIJ08550.1 acetyl-CoA C-acetyltransferase [Sphingomonas vulcanisoli]
MPADRSCHIVAFARTPFGKYQGALAAIEPRDLGTLVVDEVVRRVGRPEATVDALYAGIGMMGGAALTYTRQMLMTTVLPVTTPSLAVDRACCSGMTALGLAFKDIRLGEAELIIAGGFEGLSNTPYLMPRRAGTRPGNRQLDDPLLLRTPLLDRSISQYTSDEAIEHGVTRAAQDAWALRSHQLYFAEADRGGFDEERIAVAGLEADEAPRRDASLAALERLKTVYGTPTITAGNAPGLSDGAAFLALASGAACAALGLTPLAEIVDYVQVASGPTSGSYTPAIGLAKLLGRNALAPEDLDAIEINEAFAATPLVSLYRLTGKDRARAQALEARTNQRGGAVAIGHPLGASGGRVTMSLVQSLRRRGGGEGAAAICGGFGQGDALLLRVTG